MNRQAQIDAFLLAAHRLAVTRLHEDPARIDAARQLLTRWRAASGATRSDTDWDEWEALPAAGTPALEAAVCGEGDRAALLVSREIDLYPALHPEKSDLIDGAIGALSNFDETFGYHAGGVGPDTAVMPADWMSRSSLHCIADLTVVCPDLHHLAASVTAWAQRRAAEAAEASAE